MRVKSNTCSLLISALIDWLNKWYPLCSITTITGSFAYFDMKLGEQNHPCGPHLVEQGVCCNSTKGKRLGFGIPVVYRESQSHFDDYHCLVNISGWTSKTKSSISCPNLPSTIRPVPCLNEIPSLIFIGLVDEEEDLMMFCLQMQIQTLKIHYPVVHLSSSYSLSQSLMI